MIAVRQILGLGGIPKDRTSASEWLRRNGIPTHSRKGNGGQTEYVHLSDLLAPERLAYIERSIATLGLPLGTYDDAAHEAFMQAPASMRERTDRKAAMVRLLVSLGQRVGWPERLHLLQR